LKPSCRTRIFGTGISVEALVRDDRAEEFMTRVRDASSGKAVCEVFGKPISRRAYQIRAAFF